MKKNGNRKFIPLIVLLAVLVISGVAVGILAATGNLSFSGEEKHQEEAKNPEQEEAERLAELLKHAKEVTDIETLRELLLLEQELEIVVTKDLTVSEALLVRGDKTLYGNATLSADMRVTKTFQMLEVTKGASLTMDGLILDANCNADGIQVDEGGKLTYLSGEIIYAMYYGINVNGYAKIENVTIRKPMLAAVCANYGSEVYVEGGQYLDSYNLIMYVEGQGYLKVSGDALLSGSRTMGIRNRGTLEMSGGTIANTAKAAINNHGTCNIAYEGTDADGKIEFVNIGSVGIYNQDGATVTAKDIYAHDVKAHFANSVGGTVSISDSVVEDVKYHVFYVSAGEMNISNVKAERAGACGAYVLYPGKLSMEHVSFTDMKTRGIMAVGGEAKGNDVTITNAGTYGVTNTANSAGVSGTVTLSNATISGTALNNVANWKGSVINISNSVLNEAKRTNVYVADGTVKLTGVKVRGSAADDCAAVSVAKDGTLYMHGDTELTGHGVRGMHVAGTAHMYDGSIHGWNGTKNVGGGVQVFAGGNFYMHGGSISGNSAKTNGGGVYVAGKSTFHMDGGSINGNNAKISGGGIYVAYNGVVEMSGGKIQENETQSTSGGGVLMCGQMNMSGGEICQNKANTNGGGININYSTNGKTKEKQYGALNMSGGRIYGNYAKTNGGGVHVSGGTNAVFSGGSVCDNTQGGNGSGIMDNGYVTVSGSFYMSGNTLLLNSESIVLSIQGSALTAHNTSDRLPVAPAGNSVRKTVVINCDSPEAASSLLSYVKSGSGAYTLFQNGSTIAVDYNVADMDMTGADVVRVSNYQELAAAVKGTTGKRYVVICADIAMEGSIAVPAGTTVCIKDDGTKRTLSRSEGNSTSFFTVTYGTGLYLEGTTGDSLVLDGSISSGVEAKNVAQLLNLRGTADISGVTFQNNGGAGNSKSGMFITQSYGWLTVAGSTFRGAKGGAGTAVWLADCTASITDSEFNGNETNYYGAGAIRVESGSELTVTSTRFAGNSSATVGGAINCDGAALTVADCEFEQNVSKSNSGAINVTNSSEATVKNSTFAGNTSGGTGGAICVASSTARVASCIFEENTAVNAGGALCLASAEATLELSECELVKNTVTGKDKIGGAIYVSGGALTAANNNFTENVSSGSGGGLYVDTDGSAGITGNTFAGNRSQRQAGGAIYIKGTVTADNCSFTANVSNSRGGAIWITGAPASVAITGSEFTGNTTGVSGGAIDVNGGADGSGIVIRGCTFVDNAVRTENRGDAVNVRASVLLADCTFTGKGAEVGFYGDDSVSPAILSGTLTGVTFRYVDPNTGYIAIQKDGITEESDITIIPGAYAEGDVIFQTVGEVSDEMLTAAAKILKVAPTAENDWLLSADGTLKISGDVAKVKDKTYTVLTEAFKEAQDNDTVYLLQGVTVAETITVDKTITITNIEGRNVSMLRGSSLTDSMFIVTENGSLNISGSGDNIVTVNGNGVEATASMIQVDKGGTFELGTNAVLTNAKNANPGGALYVNGAAVLSGDVTNNIGTYGGAITVNNGAVVTIKGGKYSGNKATSNGGVALIGGTSGSLIIEDGEFYENTAQNGGVFNSTNKKGKLTIQGGSFHDNRATGNSGGVFVTSGEVEITGGTYYKNTAKLYGGVANISSAKATVSNAVIYDNSVTGANNGGAFYISKACKLTLTNCNIYDNKSKTYPVDITVGANSILDLNDNVNVGVVKRGDKTTAKVNVLTEYTGSIVLIPYANQKPAVGTDSLVIFDASLSDEARRSSAARMTVRLVDETKTPYVYDDITYCVDFDGVVQNRK